MPGPSLPRLHPRQLAALPAAVRRPGYRREALQDGIVHLGIGAFARAHLLPATEAAISAGDPRWGVVGVSLRRPDTRDALAPQQGLYALALRDGGGRQLQVLGALRELLVAPENPGAVLARIAAPATRIVSLTITEKGYGLDPASGTLRLDHADIVQDLARPDAPGSALGVLLRGLALRRAQGLPGLSLLSLDNLPANGRLLRAALLALARADGDEALADWIAQRCSFPCSMVDRIVPRSTAADAAEISAALGCTDAWPVQAEPFFDWAVEDEFVAGRPDWALHGARFVASAAPWEALKLRMVNGAHSAIAYLSLLAGWQTVDQALAQPALRHHLEALLREEVEPTLPPLPGLDLAAYRAQLLARFANPALAHAARQIAMDGSLKIPQRWLPTLRQRLQQGQPVPRLALGLAAWLQCLGEQEDAQGRPLALEDPAAATLQRLLRTGGPAAVLGHAPVFGALAGQPALCAPVLQALRALQTQGLQATLAQGGPHGLSRPRGAMRAHRTWAAGILEPAPGGLCQNRRPSDKTLC